MSARRIRIGRCWARTGSAAKTLSGDPKATASTVLCDIPVGWRGGGVAHYHAAFEEVLILRGSVTLNGARHFVEDDYFYRPADVVHGHAEASDTGCLALIRSNGKLELNLIHDPAEPDEYPRDIPTDARGHVLQLPTADLPWETAPELPGGWEAKRLSLDPQTGAASMLVRIPAGWRSDRPHGHSAGWAAFILEGGLAGDPASFGREEYAAGPAGTGIFGPAHADEACLLMLWLDPVDAPTAR